MKELNSIIAVNIAELRRSRGMTQGALGEKLNYSDKAVSKWERGESLPDISVLKQIADMFEVTVDYLLTRDHKVYKAERKENRNRKRRNRVIITLMSVVAVWAVAVFIFINFDSFLRGTSGTWLVFLYAVPTSALLALIFNTIWGKRILNFVFSSLLLWSLLASIFITLLVVRVDTNIWLLFVFGVPIQILLFLGSRIKLK